MESCKDCKKIYGKEINYIHKCGSVVEKKCGCKYYYNYNGEYTGMGLCKDNYGNNECGTTKPEIQGNLF